MRILGNIKERRQHLFCGGSPVLLLHTHTPTGTTPAALHLTRLVELLTDYTKEQLLPLAVNALTEAVRQGQGYRFIPHRVCIFLTETPDKAHCVTLTFSVQAGSAPPLSRELVTCWNASGTLQLPLQRREAHRRPRAEPHSGS